MIFPIVHFNGSGKKRLLENYEAAANAVQKAIDALQEAAPHGRDYYTIDDNAINEAIKDHKERRRKLQEVFDDLAFIWEKVEEQK